MPALLLTYIVEDSPVIRENLIATLEELAPVRVVGVADNETTSLRWLGEPGRRVDLVIVDLFLKSGSGLEVLRAIGTGPREFSLVVLSNFTAPAMRRICLELGSDRVFDKSTEIDALVTYCQGLAVHRRDGAATDGSV